MRVAASLLPLAGLAYALPQASDCTPTTVTTELIIPTSTYTFASTDVITVTATTPEDLGTFTHHDEISSTTILGTVTVTSTQCTANGTITPPATVYTTSGALANSSAAAIASTAAVNSTTSAAPAPSGYGRMFKRQSDGCTSYDYTLTTTVGVTETYLPATESSTYTEYTKFTEHWVTVTNTDGTAYAMATAAVTTEGMCGPTVNSTSPTSTITRDTRCAPTAIAAQASGFGLEWLDDTPSTPGATFITSTDDAGACCQLCVDTESCAGTAWDITTNQCRLEFTVFSGQLSCGNEAGMAFYDYGPNHPMSPGTGWYVADVCGHWNFANAKPDDGT